MRRLDLLFTTLLVSFGAACAGEIVDPQEPLGLMDVTDAYEEESHHWVLPARDLVPYARLWARFTNPTRGFWPHEAWDAVFTLRDSSPETSYKPLPGERNVIRVDLQPWLARSVALQSVSWSWEGTEPAQAEVALSEGCGLLPSQTFPWTDPRLPLDLGGAFAGCVEIRFDAAECHVTGLSVWSADPNIPWPDEVGPAPSLEIKYPLSGVIEGFYGLPWSWRERFRMVRVMAHFGLGAYLYAPKDDPFHRHLWRDPYPSEEMDRFETWNAEAKGLGVTVFFGISPFIDFDFDSEADYYALLVKVQTFLARGFTGFALLADDIEFETNVVVDGALGERHAGLVARLVSDLRSDAPEVKMWFVPTVYSDERLDRWPGAQAYLEALRALDPNIEVMWTGRRTSCATMPANDMERIRSILGRNPLIWDNFWANDGGDLFLGRLLLAPFSGRGSDLLGAVSGVAHNLSLQGALSRLTLGTFAAWLEDPSRPPKALVDRAVVAEQAFAVGAGRDTARDAETLRFLMGLFEGSAVDPYPRHEALEDAVQYLRSALGKGVPQAPARLLSTLAKMWTLPSALHHSGLDADLVDDAWFPAEKVKAEGELGLWTLALLGERLAGRQGVLADSLAEEARKASSRNRFLFGPGSLSLLLDEVRALPVVDRGFRPPTRSEAPIPACTTGSSVKWLGWTDAYEVEVTGLPGATVDERGVVIWTPPHAGTYEAVVIAIGKEGWDFQALEIACSSAGGTPSRNPSSE